MEIQQFIKYIQYPELLDSKSLPVIENLVKTFPYCQITHILYAKNLNNNNNIAYHQQLKIASLYSTDRVKFKSIITKKVIKTVAPTRKTTEHKPLEVEKTNTLSTETSSNKEIHNTKTKESLIDTFIENSPSISRPQNKFFKPIDISRESNSNDLEIVSETLAKIFYNQGKFENAINAYKKLCLKYPKKSSYFAREIEKIKKEL